MPELPEVEVIRRGIAPYVEGLTISNVTIRTSDLRWPVPAEIVEVLPGKVVSSIERRGKYLILNTSDGCVLVHLGMTGYLHLLHGNPPPQKHDHWDIAFESNLRLRLNDARRFGYLLWVEDLQSHPLLQNIGPEPLTSDLNGHYLFQKSRKKRVIIKQFLMDKKIVAGIGNIYANEALFHAGIRPDTSAGDLSLAACHAISEAVKTILVTSIDLGGTMVDFRSGIERAGQFSQTFSVYSRGGKPCRTCNSSIEQRRFGLRSIYYCPLCQKVLMPQMTSAHTC